MTLSKVDRAIRDWLKQYNPNTAGGYRVDLDQFRNWHTGPMLKATRADIQEWIAHLTEQGLANPTIRRKASSISSFYAYCLEEDLIDRNPAAHTRRPKEGDAIRLGLSPEDTRRLLTAAQQHSREAHLICSILITTGIRVSELAAARIESIGTDSGHITLAVKRKGGRTQRIPLPSGLHQLILNHTEDRTTGPILAGPRGGQPSRHRIYDIIHQVGESIGLELHPHLLRHTAATLAIRRGKHLEEVQDMLGHADPKTTRRYIRAVNSMDNSPSYDLAEWLLGDQSSKDQ